VAGLSAGQWPVHHTARAITGARRTYNRNTREGIMVNDKTNALSKPQFEGQIVKFKSPHADVILYDIAKRNEKYGWLEWWAINDPSDKQKNDAMWSE
jgi:hypothetical protein